MIQEPMAIHPLLIWLCVGFTVIGLVLIVSEMLLRGVNMGLGRWRTLRSKQDHEAPFGDAYDDPEEGRRMPPLTPPALEYSTYLGYVPKASFVHEGYRTNCYHFRYSEDFPIHKEPGEIRIFITGGSKAWGSGVTQRRLYTSLMEDLFKREHSPARIRVICAAGNAYCSVQERIMVENLVLPLEPDSIVMFSGRNDCYFGYAGKNILQEQDFFGYRKLIHKEEHTQEAPNYNDYLLKLHFFIDWLRYRRYAGHAIASKPESLPADRVVQILLDNIHIVSDIAKRHNCTFIYYLESSIFCTAKPLSPWEQSIIKRGEKKFSGFPEYNRRIYGILKHILPLDAQENGYLFLDGDEAIKDEKRSVFVDNVHFGDRGYRLVAQHMFQEMQQFFSRNSKTFLLRFPVAPNKSGSHV